MTKARKAILEMEKGKNIHTVLTETAGIYYNGIVDKLYDDPDVKALADVGIEKDLVLYLSKNINNIVSDVHLSGKHLRQVARNLIHKANGNSNIIV